MKRTFFVLALALFFLQDAAAQTGAVVYSLPRTTVTVTVTAQREAFTAGPYAQYAQKYFGVAARTQNGTSYTLQEIVLTPYVEADPAARFTVTIPDKSSANFLQFCAQGLVVMADNYTGKPAAWRFESQAGAERFEGVDPLGNLGKERTTLYKAVRTGDGYERVPVTQDNTVEKSADRKAADAAATIFSLREKRQQIATGDTDATFSGEALQAAIEEITRLEERYLSLFYGVRDVSIEEKTFDIVPDPANTTGRYNAFRVGDTLLPGSAKEGRAFTLELQKEELSAPDAVGDTRAREAAAVRYRIPAITRCRLLDGSKLLLETRVPVYQLGEEAAFPLNALLTK
ncbi:MAG: DUF4831 family protein [Bacteroidales bacterium]|nr:DUF4831 family protein [Bacteroidales bacterium]